LADFALGRRNGHAHMPQGNSQIALRFRRIGSGVRWLEREQRKLAQWYRPGLEGGRLCGVAQDPMIRHRGMRDRSAGSAVHVTFAAGVGPRQGRKVRLIALLAGLLMAIDAAVAKNRILQLISGFLVRIVAGDAAHSAFTLCETRADAQLLELPDRL